MNFGRKMMKAGVAAVAAIATLGAGGVVASTAFAGGGGGNQPGTGGDLPRCSSGGTRTMLRAHGVRPRVLIRCAPP